MTDKDTEYRELPEKLHIWAKQPGAVVSTQERRFIRDVRAYASVGVGYGWMQQVIEWLWQESPNGPAWGPEYHAKEAAALQADIARLRGSRDGMVALADGWKTERDALRAENAELVAERDALRKHAEALAAAIVQLHDVAIKEGHASIWLIRDRLAFAAAYRAWDEREGRGAPTGMSPPVPAELG